MANITSCAACGKLFEAFSEETANEPDRRCAACSISSGIDVPHEIENPRIEAFRLELKALQQKHGIAATITIAALEDQRGFLIPTIVGIQEGMSDNQRRWLTAMMKDSFIRNFLEPAPAPAPPPETGPRTS